MPLKPTYDSEIAFQSDRRKAAVEFIKINSINDAQRALEKYSNAVLRIALVKNNGEKVVYRFR